MTYVIRALLVLGLLALVVGLDPAFAAIAWLILAALLTTGTALVALALIARGLRGLLS